MLVNIQSVCMYERFTGLKLSSRSKEAQCRLKDSTTAQLLLLLLVSLVGRPLAAEGRPESPSSSSSSPSRSSFRRALHHSFQSSENSAFPSCPLLRLRARSGFRAGAGMVRDRKGGPSELPSSPDPASRLLPALIRRCRLCRCRPVLAGRPLGAASSSSGAFVGGSNVLYPSSSSSTSSCQICDTSLSVEARFRPTLPLTLLLDVRLCGRLLNSLLRSVSLSSSSASLGTIDSLAPSSGSAANPKPGVSSVCGISACVICALSPSSSSCSLQLNARIPDRRMTVPRAMRPAWRGGSRSICRK